MPSDKKYARFFTVGGKMEWSSETEVSLDNLAEAFDRYDLLKYENGCNALGRVGGFVILTDCVIVRTA